MLGLPPTVRVFICTGATDMRRSFDTLAYQVREVLGEGPLSGHLFVFRNRRGDRVKILYWDRSGYCLWYKRLEEGVFHLTSSETGRAEVTSAELSLLLEGIDLSGARQRRRYQRRGPVSCV